MGHDLNPEGPPEHKIRTANHSTVAVI